MNDKVKRYLELRKEMGVLKTEQDEIKNEMKAMFEETNLDHFETDNGDRVTYREQSRTSFDKKILAEILSPEKIKEVSKISKFKVLRIMTQEDRERTKKMLG